MCLFQCAAGESPWKGTRPCDQGRGVVVVVVVWLIAL
jgi:hypothetical protein